MVDVADKGLEIRVDHLEKDVCDLKNNDKDIFREMNVINQSYAEIKFYSKQTQENQAKMEKTLDRNQEIVLQNIQEIKDKPIKDYDRIKLAAYTFAVTYVLGTIFGLIKAFTP